MLLGKSKLVEKAANVQLRMIKSDEEIKIIKNGARIADLGGEEIVKNIREGNTEIEMKGIVEWKDGIVQRLTKGVETLVKNAGAELIHGWATFSSSKNCTVKTENGDITIEAENVIIATGSSHIDLPFMPCDEEFVLSSTGALSLEKLPKKVAIVGGGYIGLELGCALRKLGTEVTHPIAEILCVINPRAIVVCGFLMKSLKKNMLKV